MIKENIAKVRKNIEISCKKANRDTDSVKLIAVSKTKPVEILKEAYDEGIRDFGENKVQEILEKYDKLPSDIRWHMIGHLQTNKVKQVIDKAYLIHGVDSLHLANEISKQACNKNITANILVQINIGNEETKFGIDEDEAVLLVKNICGLPNICVKGLMAIAPFVENAESNRHYFQKMSKLIVDITCQLMDNESNEKLCLKELSMGMTGDYMVAIEEGATYVRVGTGIFGERNYNI